MIQLLQAYRAAAHSVPYLRGGGERERERRGRKGAGEMTRRDVLLAGLLATLIVCSGAPAAEGRKASRRLNSGYPSSGSSGVSPPYSSSPSSGSSPSISTPTPDISTPTPDISTPSPDISTPTPDTYTPSPDTSTPSPDISTPSPDITTPTPDISTPSPDISSPTPDITTPSPDTSTPTSGYGGYGSHSGYGTPKFWKGNPLKVPKILSLLSTLAKLFGPRILKLIGNRTMMGAIKDESIEPMPALAREGAASLINAYAYNDFPLSAVEVVARFNNALSSPELATQQAVAFQRYNEAV